MNQPQPNPRFQLTQTTVRLTQALVESLDQAAEQEFCSRGAIIRRALAHGLRQMEAESFAGSPIHAAQFKPFNFRRFPVITRPDLGKDLGMSGPGESHAS